ncbi:probable F420-dependent oxidoreductase, MSMEG_3544 family [Amycolatopsis sacchari]|uniref:Probable F420-dependent oxidoreductase, MSMEG_3544 family n=1 Tax=Amycolatopsis sacchari TaxID=115433 RepID=A0A1I3YQH1_9PSEU|nr:TIGR03854 family LLM class F420-dependent oxidoreductase [Amycolatopsis sacchari]SFK34010.1 probable F420-dependent oxidoreductase, MSMEG_3544 family [Amycolatopsis sacchari]
MKIRFGVGLGAETPTAELPGIVDRLEAAGIDSLWLSEHVYSRAVDPFIGMAHALARTQRLKVGTSVAVLPGRQPVLVAKQLASLAALAPKRALPVFGLRPARPRERELFSVSGPRAAAFDEALRQLRAALADESFGPVPRMDLWLGGAVPAAFERIGRYGDGWLGSFLPPSDARSAREAIASAAAEAGREIEPDHYGMSVLLAEGGAPADLAAAARERRPDAEVSSVVPSSWPELHRLLDGYLEAGLTKFVVYHRGPQPFDEFLDAFTRELLPRQN